MSDYCPITVEEVRREAAIKPPCKCPDWEEQIKHLNGPIVLQTIRSGGAYKYQGKPFLFCPWCGTRLED